MAHRWYLEAALEVEGRLGPEARAEPEARAGLEALEALEGPVERALVGLEALVERALAEPEALAGRALVGLEPLVEQPVPREPEDREASRHIVIPNANGVAHNPWPKPFRGNVQNVCGNSMRRLMVPNT